MLDYKIKELKKQIEPRENDIKNYKEQIQEVREMLTLLLLCCDSRMILYYRASVANEID